MLIRKGLQHLIKRQSIHILTQDDRRHKITTDTHGVLARIPGWSEVEVKLFAIQAQAFLS